MKPTYFISFFYITLCLPTQLFAALSDSITHRATEHKKIEFKDTISDIQQLETAIMTHDHDQFDQIIFQKPCVVFNKNPQEISDSALRLAAQIGNTHAVEKLLSLNADPNRPNEQGETALILASLNGRLDTIKELCRKNIDPDLQAHNGNTALIYASLGGYLEVVKELKNRNVKPDIRNKNGKTALDLAKEKFSNYTQIIRILEEDGYNIHPDTQMSNASDDLISACTNGSLNTVKEIVNKKLFVYFHKNDHPALDLVNKKLSAYKQIIRILEDATDSNSCVYCAIQ